MSIAVQGPSPGQIGRAESPRAGPVYSFDPLSDERWSDFLQRHPNSSVFHTRPWLSALLHTYGYPPIAFTTSPPREELRNAVVYCKVDSWLTGRRLVSLPFSDHCDLLVDTEPDVESISSALADQQQRLKLRYIEFRPTGALATLAWEHRCDVSYCLHRLDLTPSLDTLFGNLHKDSAQRKIRRAEREGLTYQEGRSECLLESFNRLWLLTRRRHMAPPQPVNWFRNLIEYFGEALKIRVAFKDRKPVAAILTLRYKHVLTYKYGCSDPEFHSLGGMHLLLWRSIQEAKRDGLHVFDLGRSHWRNRGLITFKDRWGAARSVLTYSRIGELTPASRARFPQRTGWKERIVRSISRHLPNPMFRALGALVYKHIG